MGSRPYTGDIAKIWLRYAKTKSDDARNILLEHYLPLVKKTAQRIRAKLPREVELDDLTSAGTFGLIDAICAFDPARKVKFETYCSTRIRGAILDELRSWDWVPRLARLRSVKLATATKELESELGRPGTDEELARRLDVSREELDKIHRDGSLVRVVPLARHRYSDDFEDAVEVEMPMDRRALDQTDECQRRDLKRAVIRNLTRAEQLVVMLYYYEEMTMKEIAATLDLSESRVSQMHSAIMNKLRRQMRRSVSEHEETTQRQSVKLAA